MKRVREKLTYANVVSSLCLVLMVGGGTAIAAVELDKESVGTKELAKGAVTPAKLSKAAKKGMAGKPGAPGANGGNGAPGAAGAAGAPGAAATALWAVVSAEGNVEGASPTLVSVKKRTLEFGEYEVVFNRDVSKCSMVSSSHAGPGVTLSAEPLPGNANGVLVVATIDEFNQLDNAFSLGVFC